VQLNRARLIESLGLPGAPVWLEQVHGKRVVDLDGPWTGSADAAVTSGTGTVAVIMTADCLPVLFSNRAGTRIGVAHAGWRGLTAGVLQATVEALACEPCDLLAWLGPAVGRSAYEVGDEVREAFVSSEPAAATAFDRNTRGRWQADLQALARLSLAAAGVEDVFGGHQCTWSDAERFYSHRREAPCGRMGTLIWLD